jgi:uncharacterized protein
MTVTLPRDRHLFGPGPKRILALDGGGVRGALSIGYLERLEKQIEGIAGKPIPLCDWFDLIGGTSTGAIIACALALGYRASDIRDRYKVLGPRVFRRPFYRLSGIQAKFDARSLIHELFEIYGERTLDSEDLRTGFAVVTKRLDSGSSWIVANNPRAHFWETPADASFIGNRHYRLVDLVRASAAAPYFFDPQPISIAPEMMPGVFVDGALNPQQSVALHVSAGHAPAVWIGMADRTRQPYDCFGWHRVIVSAQDDHAGRALDARSRNCGSFPCLSDVGFPAVRPGAHVLARRKSDGLEDQF